jgi:hypothetical protein
MALRLNWILWRKEVSKGKVSLTLFFCILMTLTWPQQGVTREAFNAALPSISAGAKTRGGAVSTGKIVVVSSLADSGLGTLRAAIEMNGPRVVVFEVAGTIWLRSNLRITDPYITIAGQTAPSPGISIHGSKLAIRTHNVVLQHIAVRPGGSIDPQINSAGDAITLQGCDDCRQPTQDIRIENISAGWATDEVIGIWGRTLDRVTIRNSIIAEGLNRAGHPKGAHSKGLLIGQHVQGILIAGNLFSHNVRRNPVVSSGSSSLITNNLIYNPGRAAIHLFPGFAIRTTIVGNIVLSGPNTKNNIAAIEAPRRFLSRAPEALIYATDNWCCGQLASKSEPPRLGPALVDHQPVESTEWKIIPAQEVKDWVTRYVGKRPADRDPIDMRIVREFQERGGRIVNRPEDSTGPLSMRRTSAQLNLPTKAFELATGTGGMRNVEIWLCQHHFKVGGPPTPECPAQIQDWEDE